MSAPGTFRASVASIGTPGRCRRARSGAPSTAPRFSRSSAAGAASQPATAGLPEGGEASCHTARDWGALQWEGRVEELMQGDDHSCERALQISRTHTRWAWTQQATVKMQVNVRSDGMSYLKTARKVRAAQGLVSSRTCSV